MYTADIDYAMHVHPWRKILDQCFVTRRTAYENSGGLDPDLGHFAEWVLAASYFKNGLQVGYTDQARFHHYYSGSLSELRTFTQDFVDGELCYFSERAFQNSDLLECPSEWACQGNSNRGGAWVILRMMARSLRTQERSFRNLRRLVSRTARWASPAIFGDRLARVRTAKNVLFTKIDLLLSTAFSSNAGLAIRFKNYIAALIDHQRLATIATMSRTHSKRSDPLENSLTGPWIDPSATTGFHPLEQHNGITFRWSETEAVVALASRGGAQTIEIDCVPVRDPANLQIRLFFYLNGNRIPTNQISINNHRIVINFHQDRPRAIKLGWTCLPFAAAGDPRRLGLAVKSVELLNSNPR